MSAAAVHTASGQFAYGAFCSPVSTNGSESLRAQDLRAPTAGRAPLPPTNRFARTGRRIPTTGRRRFLVQKRRGGPATSDRSSTGGRGERCGRRCWRRRERTRHPTDTPRRGASCGRAGKRRDPPVGGRCDRRVLPPATAGPSSGAPGRRTPRCRGSGRVRSSPHPDARFHPTGAERRPIDRLPRGDRLRPEGRLATQRWIPTYGGTRTRIRRE